MRRGFNKIFGIILLCMTALVYAGVPVWTFTPLTATTISIASNATATVQYRVTNQSYRSHTLMMKSITGVSQITTGPGICSNPFILASGESCVLSLLINGSQVSNGPLDGPIVCQQWPTLECYRPSPPDILTTNVITTTYTVGGDSFGLTGTLVLQNNGTDDLTITSDGPFTFSTGLVDGSPYLVTVLSAPPGEVCSVINAFGVISGANVTNVAVYCATNAYTVGGTVSGLTGTLILQNNGTDNLTINSDGSFTFSTPLADGSPYDVTVLSQPAHQTCVVTDGSGNISGADVTNVTVTCTTNDFTVGGTISGLSGTVILQNNGTDDLIRTTNGSFTFSTGIADGDPYDVTVLSQPAGQICSVTNGSGTISGADVTNVLVTCANAYTVGGTISGLVGTIVLQNNDTDDLTRSTNGAFTFSTPLIDGSTYDVTVLTQPSTGELCSVTNASGTISGANVTNVAVTCASYTQYLYVADTNPGSVYRCGLNTDGTIAACGTTPASPPAGWIPFPITLGTVGGTQYAYVGSSFSSPSAVYQCDIDSNAILSNCVITPSSGAPSWLPFGITFATITGTQYAYVSDGDSSGNGDVFQCTLNLDGSFNACTATPSSGAPLWNATYTSFATTSGTEYAYVADAGTGVGPGSAHVYQCSLNPDGSFNVCTITPSSGAPVWQPMGINFATFSGTQYAYVSDTGFGVTGNIYQCTLNPDGSLNVCTATPAVGAPAWMPNNLLFATVNGTQYAYVSANNVGVFQCTLNSDGSFNTCAQTPATGSPFASPYGLAFFG